MTEKPIFRFAVQDVPIDPDALRAELTEPRAGALVIFEGRVRNHNEDRDVVRLEYEAASEMAQNEFGKMAEACVKKFDILGLVCEHRVGMLAIGDIAVWIGVASAHRGSGYEASRFLIESLKERLPIWKKEHYADGDSGWINHP